jgi:uncharacterized protein YndB with AHSA1/START domain
MPDLLHQIRVDATPAAVFEAITTTEGLSSWWAAGADAAPTVGNVNVFRFDGGSVEFHFMVLELTPDWTRWRCVKAPKVPAEWVDTELTFKLYPADRGTLVNFAHRGWRRADGGMAPCNTVWGALMHHMRDYAEGKGKGPYFG